MARPGLTALNFTFADLLTYGGFCVRVGEMRAKALAANKAGARQEARRYWKAFYDVDEEKEKWLRERVAAAEGRSTLTSTSSGRT